MGLLLCFLGETATTAGGLETLEGEKLHPTLSVTSLPEESTSLGVSHENVDYFPPELPVLRPGDSGTTVSAI